MAENPQSRKWALTVNNPSECGLNRDGITEIIMRFSPTYACLADEIASTGTPHTHIVAELERRKDLFKECGVTNIDEYNNLGGEHLRRVIFACDEVAELLDKSGTKKEAKDMIAEIEHRISTVARMGRAFGIHLFLATQRPDAGILNGQIKNNISFAVCGRADRTLSDIILGRSDVPIAIPDNVAGRFMTRDGTVFQAYKFDPNQL